MGEAIIKRKRCPFSYTEKIRMCNMFHAFKQETPNASHNDICKMIAFQLGVHWTSIYSVVKEQAKSGLKSPKMKRERLSITDKIDDRTKSAIRSKVLQLSLSNEAPSLDKILKAVNEDGSLGTYKRSTMHRILQNIGVEYNKTSRKRAQLGIGPSTSEGSILKSYLTQEDSSSDISENKIKKAKRLIVQTEKSITLDDVIAFIGHIKSRPLVYNPAYSSDLPSKSDMTVAEMVEECWVELSLLMNWSVVSCKERWRSLKLAYILYLHAKKNDQECENYRFIPYLDFIKDIVTISSLQTEIEDDNEDIPDEETEDPDEDSDNDDECLVEAEAVGEDNPDPLETKPFIIPRVSNSFDKPIYPGVQEEIQKIRELSRVGESYFDYFRSIDLDYSLLSHSRKHLFIKACATALKHFYFESV